MKTIHYHSQPCTRDKVDRRNFTKIYISCILPGTVVHLFPRAGGQGERPDRGATRNVKTIHYQSQPCTRDKVDRRNFTKIYISCILPGTVVHLFPRAGGQGERPDRAFSVKLRQLPTIPTLCTLLGERDLFRVECFSFLNFGRGSFSGAGGITRVRTNYTNPRLQLARKISRSPT